MTDLDHETTITSIDGVGAYDLISRNAMLEGLFQMDGGDQIIPFVRMFYGSPTTYLWEDEMGTTQYIPQREGGEQGDPNMPMPHALGQHGSMVATQERMIGNEKVSTYLDDVYLASGPGRVEQVQSIVTEELPHPSPHRSAPWQDPGLDSSGVMPSRIEALTGAARAVKPDAVVWKGNPNLPPTPDEPTRCSKDPMHQYNHALETIDKLSVNLRLKRLDFHQLQYAIMNLMPCFCSFNLPLILMMPLLATILIYN